MKTKSNMTDKDKEKKYILNFTNNWSSKEVFDIKYKKCGVIVSYYERPYTELELFTTFYPINLIESITEKYE
jgi:hypothetical protein